MIDRMNMTIGLDESLRRALAGGAVGMTLRTGEQTIIYFAKGRRSVQETCPSYEDVNAFLRYLMTSRERRLFRERGVVHFKRAFAEGIELLGGARMEKDELHVELRRMAGPSPP